MDSFHTHANDLQIKRCQVVDSVNLGQIKTVESINMPPNV